MNDTGTALDRSPIGFDQGADESQASNRIFVNLRLGRITQTWKPKNPNDPPPPGFSPQQTKTKDGRVNHFTAKTFDHITGFVNDIRWHTHKLADGTLLAGWNITIDAADKGVFVLGVNTNERPYQRLMNCLLSVDFTQTVRFIGFMGKNPKTEQPQRVLLLTQGLDPETKKPIWIQPVHQEKWLSRLLIQKLREKIPLTEHEEGNVSRMKDGSFNKDYPYIVQNANESWSFDAWNNFLHEQMEEFVIPNVQTAAEDRGNRIPPASVPTDDVPDMPEFAGTAPADDDDMEIPF